MLYIISLFAISFIKTLTFRIRRRVQNPQKLRFPRTRKRRLLDDVFADNLLAILPVPGSCPTRSERYHTLYRFVRPQTFGLVDGYRRRVVVQYAPVLVQLAVQLEVSEISRRRRRRPHHLPHARRMTARVHRVCIQWKGVISKHVRFDVLVANCGGNTAELQERRKFLKVTLVYKIKTFFVTLIIQI